MLTVVARFFAVWRILLTDKLKLIPHFTCREKASSLYLENQRKITLTKLH